MISAEELDFRVAELEQENKQLKRMIAMESTNANDTQVGGDHYKTMNPQPWDVMEALLTPEEFRGYLKGNMIKYAMRQGKKDSPDAGKYHHYKQKLMEYTEGETWL
jgi:hypothetical protein